MDAYRISITLRVQSNGPFELEQVVPVFHKWIQGQLLPGHLLIDVADYLHVEGGPGVVLVSHEANIGLSSKEGAVELTYQRKRPFGQNFADRLATVLGAALASAKLLQDQVSGLTVSTDNIKLRILDKLNAANEPATFKLVVADIESLFKDTLGFAVQVEHRADPLKHFEARVRIQSPPALAELLQRLSVPA